MAKRKNPYMILTTEINGTVNRWDAKSKQVKRAYDISTELVSSKLDEEQLRACGSSIMAHLIESALQEPTGALFEGIACGIDYIIGGNEHAKIQKQQRNEF